MPLSTLTTYLAYLYLGIFHIVSATMTYRGRISVPIMIRPQYGALYFYFRSPEFCFALFLKHRVAVNSFMKEESPQSSN